MIRLSFEILLFIRKMGHNPPHHINSENKKIDAGEEACAYVGGRGEILNFLRLISCQLSADTKPFRMVSRSGNLF